MNEEQIIKTVQECEFPRFVYSSSPDRGLDTLLNLFPQIRKEFPDANLHVFYGFSNWLKAIQNGTYDENNKKWCEQIMANLEQPGVHNHGKVSQKTLAKVWQLADIWFYPTNFWETYCWSPDSLVETENSNVPIEDIVRGDKVLTHTGQYKEVTDVMSRTYEGEIFQISVTTTMRPLQCTPEHPIYAVKRKDIGCIRGKGRHCRATRFEYICKKGCNTYKTDCKFLHVNRMIPRWIPARDLEKGDYMVYPIDREIEDREIVQIDEMLQRSIDKYEVKKDGGIAARAPRIKRTYTSQLCNAILVNNAFMRISGYYLAEGSSHPRSSTVSFAFNTAEQKYVDEVQVLMEEVFGLKANRLSIKGNSTNIIYNSVLLAEFFEELFGKGARNKCMPEWFLHLPLDKQKELLIGLFRGDGCCNMKSNSILIELASERLIRQIWKMLLRFDIVAGLYNSYKKVPKYPLGSGYHEEKRPYYKVSFQGPTLFDRELGYHINKKTRKSNLHSVIINDQLFMPIRKISKILYEGKVCNLEVKEDHSYIIENISAHNCITALEAQLSETIIVCSDLAGLKTTVADRGILISGEGDTPAYTEAYQKRALQEVFAILRDDERRKMMTAKAKEWAVQQTWANRAKEWLGIFGLMPPIK